MPGTGNAVDMKVDGALRDSKIDPLCENSSRPGLNAYMSV